MGTARFLSVLPDNSSLDLFWRSQQVAERQRTWVPKPAGKHGTLRGSVECTLVLRERRQETGCDQEDRQADPAGESTEGMRE